MPSRARRSFGYTRVRGLNMLHATLSTTTGAQVSVTVRMTPNIKAAVATIGDDAWTTIDYTDAILDEDTGELISRAEVAEVPFTAFASRKEAEHLPGRLLVGRIPDVNAPADHPSWPAAPTTDPLRAAAGSPARPT